MMYHLTRVPGILPSVATAPFRVLQVLLFAMKFVEDRYRANKLGGVVAPEEAAEEPASVAKVTGEEEKENSAPVDASIGKEMPLTELQPEDAAAVPLSFLED